MTETLEGQRRSVADDPDATQYPDGINQLHPTPFIQKMIDKMVREMRAKGIDR